MFDLPIDLIYVLLIFAMFVVSRYLQRFRIPSAITCLALGIGFGMGLGTFQDAPTIKVLSLIGIVALFLFAGMEVDFPELRRGARVLLQHVLIQSALTGLSAWVVASIFGLETRPALLVALALFTPSTGFILDSLSSLGVTDEERFWIKSKAIASELVALGILFFTLQSSSWQTLGLSSAALGAMVLLLPLVFRAFASFILPHAPKTEFAFLVILALLCAMVTKKLGVYYLVGAFVVGLTEQRLRKTLPELTTPQLVHAIELFASFFIPFYFFKAGLGLQRENFSVDALLLGAAFLLIAAPVRIGLVCFHRRLVLKEGLGNGLRVGVSVVPTLVFTIVLAEILRDRFAASPTLVGGLILYTLGNTLIPGFFLRAPAAEYDTPEILLDVDELGPVAWSARTEEIGWPSLKSEPLVVVGTEEEAAGSRASDQSSLNKQGGIPG